MALKDNNDKTQTSTSAPWDAVQPYLQTIASSADRMWRNGAGKPPQLADVNGYTKEAFRDTANIAHGGVPGLGDAFNFTGSMLTGQGTPAADALSQFAGGQFQEDPRLQQMLDTNAGRAANAAATRFGGGRYGSAAIGQGVGQAVADANNATMLQANENARNRQLSAAGTLGSLGMQSAAMLPTLNNLQYDPASRLAGIGDFWQQRAQQRLDNKRNYRRDDLSYYASILNGMGGLGGTKTMTTPGPSTAQRVLGGAATGGALLGPLGAVGGGLLGLL